MKYWFYILALLTYPTASLAKSTDTDVAGGGILLVIMGVFFFFQGFRKLQKKRLIENTPTSKIRSMAMGLVEVYGKARTKNPLKAPFSGASCVYYQYEVFEYRTSGKNKHWVSVASGASEEHPFLIEDETGVVEVLPRKAEATLKKDRVIRQSWGSSIPASAMNALEKMGHSTKGFLGLSKDLKLEESYLAPGDEVFVLGTAKNENGKITISHYFRQPLIIFDSNEKSAISKLSWQVILKVFGGPILVAAGAFILYELLIKHQFIGRL